MTFNGRGLMVLAAAAAMFGRGVQAETRGVSALIRAGDPATAQADVCAPTLYWGNAAGFGEEPGIFRWRFGDLSPEKLSPCGQIGGLALDTEHARLFWTDFVYDGVRRAELDGSDPVDVFIYDDIYANPRGIAVDPRSELLFWSERSSIATARLDGSEHHTVIDDAGGDAAIAIDLVHDKLYWTSGTSQFSIQRANLDGSGVELLVPGAQPTGLALDVAGGKMYWADRGIAEGSAIIRRASLDGTGNEILVGGLEPNTVFGIALDLSQRKMYWGGFGSGDRIRRANLDGSDVEDVIGPVGIIGALAVIPAEDHDQDGACDAADECPSSDPRATVVLGDCDSGVPNRIVSGGCELSDMFSICRRDSPWHGEFVNCVARLATRLERDDMMAREEATRIRICAARSEAE